MYTEQSSNNGLVNPWTSNKVYISNVGGIIECDTFMYKFVNSGTIKTTAGWVGHEGGGRGGTLTKRKHIFAFLTRSTCMGITTCRSIIGVIFLLQCK